MKWQLLLTFTAFLTSQTTVWADDNGPAFDPANQPGWDREIPSGLDRDSNGNGPAGDRGPSGRSGRNRGDRFQDGSDNGFSPIPFTPPSNQEPVSDPLDNTPLNQTPSPLPTPTSPRPFPETPQPTPSEPKHEASSDPNVSNSAERLDQQAYNDTTYQPYVPAEEVSEDTMTFGASRDGEQAMSPNSSFMFVVTGTVSSVNKKKGYIVVEDKRHDSKMIFVKPEVARTLREGSVIQTWLKPGTDTAEKVQQIR
jgi:hypothetical protein